MARDYLYVDEYDSDSHRRSSDRSRRHQRRHRSHREEDQGTYDRNRGEDPDIEEVRRARVDHYITAPEERRRQEDDYRRTTYDPEPRRSSRRSYEEDDRYRVREGGERRRRRRRHAEEDEEGADYVYRIEEPSSRSRRRDMDTPSESPPPVEQRKSSRTVRTSDGRTVRRSRAKAAPRVADEVAVEDDAYDAPPPRVRRGTSTRDPQRVYMTRPSVKRSQTTLARDPTTSRTVRRAPSAARLTSAHVSPVRTKRPNPGFLSLFTAAPRPPSAPTPVRRVQCLICSDDVSYNKVAKLGCGHYHCNSCLKNQFEMSVKDPQHMPPRCCTEDHIPLKHVDRLFGDAFKRMWNTRYQEYTTSNRLYCPKRGCGEWIKPSCIKTDRETRRKYGKCPRCSAKVCVLCNNKWHTREDCPNDEETKRIVDMAKEQGWQRCYNCKNMVELKEGCYHMTCRCNAQFCMLCAKPWKTCTCPWFEHPDLDPADRLGNMQVPQTYLIPEEPERPTPPPPPAPAPAYSRRIHPIYTSSNTVTATSPRRSQSTRTSRPDPRSRAFLSRLITTQMNLSPPPARPITPPDDRTAHAQVYGIGNSGSHHMNESYTVRPTTAITPAAAPQVSISAARRAWGGLGRSLSTRDRSTRTTPNGGRTHARAASATVRPPSEPPKSSIMAGLGKTGNRGANRVNGWLVHIVNDPEAVNTASGGVGEIEVDSDSDFDTPY